MKVAELLEARRENWRQLEQLCVQMETRRKRGIGAADIARFGALYRAACADLALADSYQLPSNTVFYLHQLVGRAHNQIYRSRRFNFKGWGREMFFDVPQRLFADNFLRLAFVLFWATFLGSALRAHWSPEYAQQMLGKDGMTQLEENFSTPIEGRDSNASSAMVGFYIQHNTGIGLQCFALGLVYAVPGLFVLVTNGLQIGAAFGYMSIMPQRQNFFHFVTAHGPFELTAVVLSAAAGMRMGFALIRTDGQTRGASLRKAASEAMPIVCAAMLLFALAGLIEAFLSPSKAPYQIKALVAVLSSMLLMFYFVVLGYPRGNSVAA